MANDGTTSLGYATTLYKAMLDNSQVEFGHTVWRGSITKLAKELEIPQGSYRRVVSRMEEMGCLELLMRGTRGYQSVYVVKIPPTAESWGGGSTPLTERVNHATLTRRLDDIEKRLGGLHIAEAISTLDQRVKQLEVQANASKSKPQDT